MEVSFGALADPLSKQFAGMLPPDALRKYDELAKAIVRLHVHGLLPDGAVHAARKKLLKKIEKEIVKERKP